MEKLTIICIDDQREVLAALRKDLEELHEFCSIADCESADEAVELLDEIDEEGEIAALLICDHVMPGKNGVELLAEINQDLRFPKIKKLLLTGLATHQDTILAINKARIDHYIEKPWKKEDLLQQVKNLLTLFLLQSGIEYKPYLPVLDQETLYREIRLNR